MLDYANFYVTEVRWAQPNKPIGHTCETKNEKGQARKLAPGVNPT